MCLNILYFMDYFHVKGFDFSCKNKMYGFSQIYGFLYDVFVSLG